MTHTQQFIEDGCRTCGREKRAKEDTYCSRECWYVQIRKPRPNCHWCGRSCKAVSRKFCSPSCNMYARFSDKSRHPRWNNDASTKYQKLRNSVWKQLEAWRKAVLARDGTCVTCGATNRLQAHHIKPFMHFAELRFDIANGQTLCLSCHIKTDTYGKQASQYALASGDDIEEALASHV